MLAGGALINVGADFSLPDIFYLSRGKIKKNKKIFIDPLSR